MERYAVIEFKSAKFVKSKGDIIITKNQYRKRTAEESLDERQDEKSLIRTHQISAMIVI